MDAFFNEESGTWVARKELDTSTCSRIISLAEGNWEPSSVESSSGGDGEDSSLRVSDIFFTSEQWLVDIIFPYMDAYNDVSGLGFDIRSVEVLQLTRYAPGGFYDFHIDGFGSKRFSVKGNVRKISMSLQLNDGYLGGDFQIVRCRKGKIEIDTLDKSIGSLILFPSSLEHRVTPVTEGIRYSLVAWFLGPPFK
jgi:PKHD-type hydroxylase